MAEPVDFIFYRDVYRGSLPIEAFAEALPAAASHVSWLCGGLPEESFDEAYRRAVCAAADVFAERGCGGMDSFTIGSFKVGTSALSGGEERSASDLATEAALRELSGTGAAFCGAVR